MSEYDPAFVTALEWIWGEGFLSPGGPEEVATLLEGMDIRGLNVLDVGCGLGGVDLVLVQEHGAGRVVGIDVVAQLVTQATERVAQKGLAERIQLQRVAPGPLPFPDRSFDLVFSKDSIIHIPDKAAFYAEVLRVLPRGGHFVCSDWLRDGEGTCSPAMQEWLDQVGLRFAMQNPAQTRAALEAAGFAIITMRDRNAWYREQIRQEIASVSGEGNRQLAQHIGEEAAAHRLRSSRLKQQIVEQGELRPTHFVCQKP